MNISFKWYLFSGLMFLVVLLGVVMSSGSAPDNTELTDIEWQDKIEVASGEAYQGPWRMNDSEFHYVDDPAVTITDDGWTAIAWANQREQDLFFQIYSSDGKPMLDGPTNISQSAGIFSWLPSIVTDPGNRELVYVLWQDIVFSGGSHGGEIIFSRSTDGGKSFEEPINLSNTMAGAGKGRLTAMRWDNGSLDLEIGPEGNLYATWTEYEGALRFSRSTDQGQTFTDPVHITGSHEIPARGPALAVDNNGTIHLIWTVGEDDSADIRYATSSDYGDIFSEPEIVNETSGHSDAPRLVVDREGTVHMVHAEGDRGMFSTYSVQYSRKKQGDNKFEEARTLSGNHSSQVRSSSFPDLALDDSGNLYLLWELYPDGGRHSMGLGFTYSTDSGANFSSPGIIPGTVEAEFGANGSRQGSLMNKLSVNSKGEIAIANSTFMQGVSSHIWLFRGQSEL